MSRIPRWKPRASKVGSYFSCDLRAFLDRQAHEHGAPRVDQGSKMYADFGTLCHYQMMMDMGLEFPDGKETPSAAYVDSAKDLFKGDVGRMQSRMTAVSTLAQSVCPAAPEGQKWLAETHYKLPHLSGSIDFISSCGTAIGDLKTTSRKPDKDRIKTPHLYQILCYDILARSVGLSPTHGWVLYVGSLTDWTLLVQFRLDTPEMDILRADITRYIHFLRSKRLATTAVPRLGPHCDSDFCDHVSVCRDRFMPTPGESSVPKAHSVQITLGNPFAK